MADTTTAVENEGVGGRHGAVSGVGRVVGEAGGVEGELGFGANIPRSRRSDGSETQRLSGRDGE